MSNRPEDYAVVMTTTSSAEEADRIARQLVEKRLTACVNVVDGIRSFYIWEDRMNEDSEKLLLVKIRSDSFGKVSEFISEMHSYQCPEIIMVPLLGANPLYLAWLNAEIDRD